MNIRVISTAAFLVMGSVSIVIADPLADPWYAFCGSPIATCDQPRPSSAVDWMRGGAYYLGPLRGNIDSGTLRLPVVAPKFRADGSEAGAEALWRGRPAGPQPVPHKEMQEVRAVLGLWQAATMGALPATNAQQLLLAQKRDDLTGRQRVIVSQFRGPVDAETLSAEYDWTLKNQGRTRVLIATPNGVLDRLFCGRIAIEFGKQNRPVSLAFVGSEGEAGRAVALHGATRAAPNVVTAYYAPATTDAMIQPASATEGMVPERSIVTEPAPRLLRIAGDIVFPMAPIGDILRREN